MCTTTMTGIEVPGPQQQQPPVATSAGSRRIQVSESKRRRSSAHKPKKMVQFGRKQQQEENGAAAAAKPSPSSCCSMEIHHHHLTTWDLSEQEKTQYWYTCQELQAIVDEWEEEERLPTFWSFPNPPKLTWNDRPEKIRNEIDDDDDHHRGCPRRRASLRRHRHSFRNAREDRLAVLGARRQL